MSPKRWYKPELNYQKSWIRLWRRILLLPFHAEREEHFLIIFISRTCLKSSSNWKLFKSWQKTNKLKEVRKGTRSGGTEERLIEKLCSYGAFNALGDMRTQLLYLHPVATVTDSLLELHFHKSHSQAVMWITAVSLAGEHRFWKPVSISYRGL